MKELILLTTPFSILLATSFILQAQGFVAFNTPPNTRITSVLTGQPTFGTNTYRFGLYVGTLGSTPEQLVLVGIATNTRSASASASSAGHFNGGSPFVLPQPYGDSFVEIAFQVRGWSFDGGLSYEAAYTSALAGNTDILLGQSALGYVNPGHFTQPPPPLFGTGVGRVGGFALALIPEPSTAALAGLGLAVLVLFRRRPQRCRDRGGT